MTYTLHFLLDGLVYATLEGVPADRVFVPVITERLTHGTTIILEPDPDPAPEPCTPPRKRRRLH